VAKTLDDEYEFAEAVKFRMLAVMFQNQGPKAIAEKFFILAALCEEKEKILKSLADQVVFKPSKAEGKLIDWPTYGTFTVKKHAGDN
jgi:hypothetical protein